jgi:hypothetical protein
MARPPVTVVLVRGGGAVVILAAALPLAAAVPGLDTADEAKTAGYTKAAVQVAGIGAHWVNWALIDAPFDPTRPAMLLFDERRDRENVASRADCAGHVLAGSDLWMLHAWVVPGWENRWGNFATHHPALCPSAVGTPDIIRCPAS